MGFLSGFNENLERNVRGSAWLGEGIRTRTIRGVRDWALFMVLLVGSFWIVGVLDRTHIIAIIIGGALCYGLMMFAFVTRSPGPMKVALAIILLGAVVTTVVISVDLFDGR